VHCCGKPNTFLQQEPGKPKLLKSAEIFPGEYSLQSSKMARHFGVNDGARHSKTDTPYAWQCCMWVEPDALALGFPDRWNTLQAPMPQVGEWRHDK
jgi:hypothetical protein